MKNTSKLACLFSLWLLSGLCMLASVNITNGAAFNIDLNFWNNLSDTTHKSRLKTLFLWWGESWIDSPAWMTTSSTSLDVFKGLIVDRNGWTAGNYSSVVIGGWKWNQIQSDKSGIAGWASNHINPSAELAAIGWWASNTVSQKNWVIAWWSWNTVEGSNVWWVVLWGADNKSDAGVVLWWQGNEIGKNGLAMWVSAKWAARSFVRNDGTFNGTASEGSAVIWTKNGVLIWTYTPVTGASLVVNWAVKIWNNSGTPVTWEIRLENDCLYAFDGFNSHALGKNSQASCNGGYNMSVVCEFGRILLQEGDVIEEAYSQAYASNCDTVKAKVTCKNVNWAWKLVPDSWTAAAKYYPSCFKTDWEPYHW